MENIEIVNGQAVAIIPHEELRRRRQVADANVELITSQLATAQAEKDSIHAVCDGLGIE